MTIGGHRPPKLGGDVTFKHMRAILAGHLEYEQKVHVAIEDGGDRMLASRRALISVLRCQGRDRSLQAGA